MPCTPVPQAHTHKANPAEVLLTSWCRTAPDTYTVNATWPATHDFYATRHGLHDPLLLSETVRQTLPLLSHAAYQVPFGHQLLWQSFRWDLEPGLLRAEGRPAAVELRIVCSDVRYRKERAAAMVLSAQAWREGCRLAEVRTYFTVQDRAIYTRLRGAYADIQLANARALPVPPPVPAHLVGKDRGEDVVLAAAEGDNRWQLRVDTSHPILFDHPVDHAPGMLLLEAARQAAQATAHPRATVVTGMDTTFIRYAELDAPCWIDARPLPGSVAGPRRVLVTARQHGEEIFTDVVTLSEA
ncbi:ScbA/BarX family gamma-butyrolactone biosynthesis protein [Streptomyces naphthomycinicus]|uniref:ScbA/BarX family gamma-butyrolactone biosynthesis protein n=1 Tax=Streptomyces naphthomycinicus TaxID=2872625 RepID=UPI001CEC3A07|nr:ScbA/BarX family gamma-butyrolactone biosynthesis protein [Streptomyces sp. TML10]